AELIDTAGWQVAASAIEAQAQRLGSEQTTRADVIVWCDEHGEFSSEDEARLNATGAHVLKVRTKSDLASVGRKPHDSSLHQEPPDSSLDQGAYAPRSPVVSSVVAPNGLDALRAALSDIVVSLTRPALTPSQSRCRHHVIACLDRLREAHMLCANDQPPELLALALRGAIESLGEMTGAVYTNDLLDRIFSRFCIGK
ncbi:MAG: hypothetical protein L0241_26590, partial [Planctomycetia bacterium]|nr:hypothetical protein [Planctomycetia bacterium]